MQIILAKSKISGLIVEDANIHYEGSITLHYSDMLAAGIVQNEQVHVLDITNGERLVTYAISGEHTCINGAAAKLINIGDEIIVLAYGIYDYKDSPELRHIRK